MKLSEIRKKFPMYADVPDEQLLIGMHRKYYSDMPFQEFNKAIQYDNAPDPTQGMSGMQKHSLLAWVRKMSTRRGDSMLLC
jgi:hypothetical protein